MGGNSIGRYFQLAALAAAGIKEVGDSLILPSGSDYKDLVVSAGENVMRAKLGQAVSLADPQALCDSLQLVAKLGSPKFYYNRSVDEKALTQAGLTRVCGQDTRGETRLIALSYIENVLRKGGPLSIDDVSVPMIFRVTLFSKTRGPVAAKVEKTSADALGLAIIGALASFLDRVLAGKDSFEYYLIPDGSRESMDYFVSVLEALGRPIPGAVALPDAIKNLVTAGGFSIDMATYMAVILRATSALSYIQKVLSLAEQRVFESFILVRLNVKGNRPQMSWAGPLAVSETILRVASSPRLSFALRALYNSLTEAQQIPDERGEKCRSVVRECISALALSMMVSRGDTTMPQLYFDCARNLSSLIDYLSRYEDPRTARLRENASRVLEKLG